MRLRPGPPARLDPPATRAFLNGRWSLRDRHRDAAELPTGATSDGLWPAGLERRNRPRPALHFRRLELKYAIPERLVPLVIAWLSPWTRLDPFLARVGRSFYPVTSLYFDSFDLQCLREKDAGLHFRRKIRLRVYETAFSEEGVCFLEIKRRLDALVFKDRISLPQGVVRTSFRMPGFLDYLLREVGDADDTWMEAQVLSNWFNLRSTALVRYKRYAFIGADDPNVRITVDADLEGMWKPATIVGDLPMRSVADVNGWGLGGVAGRYVILELKFNHTVPGWFHRIVKDLELIRIAYSKYALVAIALKPAVAVDCHPDFEREMPCRY